MVNLRRWSALAAVVGALGLITMAPGWATEPTPRWGGDEIDSMRIEYAVAPDGVLSVRETIVYRFGPSSGRHGIYRDLVTREPFDSDNDRDFDENLDQKYDVSDVRVSSPDADPQFTSETERSNRDRNETLRLRIGDPNVTISADTATYVIDYRVRGAMRYFDDHSELYWDATGTGWDANLNQVRVTVTGPQAVREATCFVGRYKSTAPCSSANVSGGRAEFDQTTALPKGTGVTIVAAFPAGAVTGNGPSIEAAPPLLTRLGLSVPMVAGSGASMLAIPAVGLVLARRARSDERFDGVPPGTLPATGSTPRIRRDNLATKRIPVAFAPPPISVAEAGLLIDGKLTSTETAATLIDLAVRGVLRIDSAGDGQHAVLLDPYRAELVHEQVLVRQLFPTLQPGSTAWLGRRPATGDDSMQLAHNLMTAQVRLQVQEHGWYRRLPGGSNQLAQGACCLLTLVGGFVMFGGFFMVVIATLAAGVGKVAAVLVPVLVLLGTGLIVFWARRHGCRSATGRAMCDQVVGFKTYLATAEADQLRFEEGEDIFSKYLPWAIAFNLAARWQRICAQLVAAGRIPARPGWYAGDLSTFSAVGFSTSVASTFSPPPSSSGGGGGFSSGSSGGSSGGGGGGGGGGSW